MKALTLHQPWAWAIAHADKRIENRSWRPPASIVGKRIAIHAGLKLDRFAADDLADDFGLVVPADIVRGAVVAVATVSGCSTMYIDRWHVPGQIGWRLQDVVTLAEPVRCRGAQGLWNLPPQVLAAVEAQL